MSVRNNFHGSALLSTKKGVWGSKVPVLTDFFFFYLLACFEIKGCILINFPLPPTFVEVTWSCRLK